MEEVDPSAVTETLGAGALEEQSGGNLSNAGDTQPPVPTVREAWVLLGAWLHLGQVRGQVLALSQSPWVPRATPWAVPGSSFHRAGGSPAMCHRPAQRLGTWLRWLGASW